MKQWLMVLIGLLVFTACNSTTQLPLSSAELKEFRACSVAGDCVYAQNGCCDCANGGEAVAVSKEKASEFAAEFDCANYPCTQIAAVPPCNVGTVSCEEKLCTFTRP